MIKLTINNIYTKIENLDKESKDLVSKFCNLAFLTYKIGWNRKGTYSNVYKNYFKSDKFPTGWVFEIKALLNDNDIAVDIIDNRNKLEDLPKLTLPDSVEARKYQDDFVEITNSKCRGIVRHPTRSGKTYLAAKVIANISQTALVLVPNITLLSQTYDDFVFIFGEENVGKIGGKEFDPKRITIASPQKLWASIDSKEVKDFLKSIGLLFIDECHHVTNTKKLQWYAISQKCINAYYRYGLTGTLSEDSAFKVLRGTTGKILQNIEEKDLIAQGYLAQPVLEMYKIFHKNDDIFAKKSEKVYPDYEIAFAKGILDNAERNSLIVKIALEEADENRSVLILVNRIEKHGKVLYDMFDGKAVFASGETKPKDRDAIKKRFLNKEFLILVGTIFGEGVNIPNLDTVIYAYGGKSKQNVLQGVGRVLTPCKGKKPKIIDFYDIDNGILEAQAKKRLKLYEGRDIFKVNLIEDQLSLSFGDA